MAAICMSYNIFDSPHIQAHSGCVGTDNHDGLYPDLSPFQSLRRGRAVSSLELNRVGPGGAGNRHSGCERRASLRHFHVNSAQCLNNRNNNSSKNNISNNNSSFSRGSIYTGGSISNTAYNDNKFYHSLRGHHHYLSPDWEDEDKAHSNMFSFQNCTLQSEDGGNGDSYWVSFEEKSFCKGKAFKVYSGKMNGRGKKSGDRCVVKVFRKCMGTKSLCSCEMKKSETARDLARAFTKSARERDVHVRFAATYWALMDEVSRLKTLFFSGERPLSSKEAVLFEDDVRMDGERPNKTRRLSSFMDARGRPGTSRATELDAFTHFSYHESGGHLVICGLEGVHDSEGFFLKTPTIHSRAREFGNSDGGMHGIREVFRHHVCNSVCKDMRKPTPDEGDNEKTEHIPRIAQCATSGVSVDFSGNKNISTPSSRTTPELSSQNSHLSRVTNFSDTSNSLDPRVTPSAPELLSDHHDFSRSISCPPTQYESPDYMGASWFIRDGRHGLPPEANLLHEPKVLYMHQNSVPVTLLTSTPQPHTIRDPITIHTTTASMVDLHIQDENANPWRRNVVTPTTVRFELANSTAYSPDYHCHTQTPHSNQNKPIDQNPTFSASTPKRSDPQPTQPSPFQGPSIGANTPAEANEPYRQSPQRDDASHCPPDYPPSYADSQIATAYWVMQRGYGYKPGLSTGTQFVLPWEQGSTQPHGRRSPDYPGNQ